MTGGSPFAFTPAAGGGIATSVLGTTTNDNAAAGYVGEYISANSAGGIAPGASGAWKTIASCSLTAGDWDVDGVSQLSSGTLGSGTGQACAISLTTNALDSSSTGGVNQLRSTVAASSNTYIPTGARRISIAATTTVYLVAAVNYSSVGTAVFTSESFIQARRRR